MSAPEVSIVIPTYERRRLIGPTLAGALAQEDVDFEIVAVVDRSPSDDTADALRAIGDPRLRVIEPELKRGVSAARNLGISEARGEWIALLDDDDLWSPRKLREQLDIATASTAQMAFSAAAIVDPKVDVIGYYLPSPPSEQPCEILRRSAVPAGCSNLVVRSDLLREVGPFDEQMGPLTDWDLFARLLLAGSHAISEEVHVGYVFHPLGMTATNIERHFSDFDVIEERYRRERAEHGVTLDGVLFSRWLAGGLRRGGSPRDAIRAYLWGARRYRDAGNVVRALGVLMGPKAMRAGRALRGSEDHPPDPDWLDLYRPDGRLARDIDELASTAA